MGGVAVQCSRALAGCSVQGGCSSSKDSPGCGCICSAAAPMMVSLLQDAWDHREESSDEDSELLSAEEEGALRSLWICRLQHAGCGGRRWAPA